MNGGMDDRRGRGDDDWDDRRRGDGRRGLSGVDPLIDRALRLTKELYDVLRRAEAQVDDAVRDLQKAESIERRAEGYERKGKEMEDRAERIEREALGDLTGRDGRRGERGRY